MRKVIHICERSLTSARRSEYSDNTKRVQYSSVPTSTITAETVTVDGFTLSPENSPVTETSFGAESLEDGVYSITTTTHYNASGQPLTSIQKQLITQIISNGFEQTVVQAQPNTLGGFIYTHTENNAKGQVVISTRIQGKIPNRPRDRLLYAMHLD